MKIRLALPAILIAIALFVTGCTKKESTETSEEPPPTAVVDPSTAGTITGMVVLEGTPPKFKPLDMSAEPACVQANPKSVTPPVVITGEKGALANAVIYVKSGLGRYRYDLPQQPVELDQKGCMYDPRVLAVMTNQKMLIRNDDPTIHNVHPIPRVNHPWNKSEPVGDPPIETSFPKPELAILIACNIHPWMRAFLFVFDNPYFAVTPKTGAFELKNLPPGTYTIEAWHERFGTFDQTVTLAPKESKALSFIFKVGSPQ